MKILLDSEDDGAELKPIKPIKLKQEATFAFMEHQLGLQQPVATENDDPLMTLLPLSMEILDVDSADMALKIRSDVEDAGVGMA